MIGKTRQSPTDTRWSSRFIFLLSAMGCTIGLGNIWRFPYITGENGGGVFILVYLACLLCLAVPGVTAELLVGRRGRAGAAKSFGRVATEAGASKRWSGVGHIMVLGGALVLCYYPVVGSWSIEYVLQGLTGQITAADPDDSQLRFKAFMDQSVKICLLFTIFHSLAVYTVHRGLHRGIEQAIKLTMPLFFILLCGLLLHTAATTGIGRGINFLFAFDLTRVTPQLVLAACGQAVFTTAVGQANLLAYAAYLEEGVRLHRYGGLIVAADTVIAILAGILIFSIVFAFGLNPGAGAGLAYSTLPVAFSNMPWGDQLGCAFFLLLTLAAFTSTIPAIEVVSRWLSDHGRITHATAALIVGAISWLIGLLVVFSLARPDSNPVSNASRSLLGTTLLDTFDTAASSLILPVAVILLAVFAGWIIPWRYFRDAIGRAPGLVARSVRLMLRYLVPPVIAGILLANLL